MRLRLASRALGRTALVSVAAASLRIPASLADRPTLPVSAFATVLLAHAAIPPRRPINVDAVPPKPRLEDGGRLWLEVYRRDLSTDAIGASAGFTAGQAVGEAARRIYDPDG
jgi:hypothetical protein